HAHQVVAAGQVRGEVDEQSAVAPGDAALGGGELHPRAQVQSVERGLRPYLAGVFAEVAVAGTDVQPGPGRGERTGHGGPPPVRAAPVPEHRAGPLRAQPVVEVAVVELQAAPVQAGVLEDVAAAPAAVQRE